MMQELKTRAEDIDCKGFYFERRMCSKYFLLFQSYGLHCVFEDILVFHISCQME